jgi:hypothetical protein
MEDSMSLVKDYELVSREDLIKRVRAIEEEIDRLENRKQEPDSFRFSNRCSRLAALNGRKDRLQQRLASLD